MNNRIVSLALLILLVPAVSAATGAPPAGTTPPAPAPVAPADAADDDDPVDEPVEAKVDPMAEKYWDAILALRSSTPAEVTAGRARLEEAANAEYTPAQVLLGDCLLSGSYGFKKDARRAAALFRLAAERGNAFGQVSIGQCLLAGTGVRRDRKRAEQWLTAALAPAADFVSPAPSARFLETVRNDLDRPALAEIDPVDAAQARAHFLLGLLLNDRKEGAAAQQHFVAAATAGPGGRAGLYPAAVMAAINYAFGRGVPRDLAKATEVLHQSSKLNRQMTIATVHQYADLKIVDDFAVADLEEDAAEASSRMEAALQFDIAETLANRKSKDFNAAEALRWYELAAESGQTWPLLSLGLVHARGQLGAPDPAKAFQCFERIGAGRQPKHLLGAANLALCHLRGIGTAADPARAAEIFRLHRDREIICYLGSIGQAPAGVVTFEEALALNETWAKTRKDPHAQYLLGLRYLNGWGVKADARKAMTWLRRAVDGGDPRACGLLGLLVRAESPREATRLFEQGLAAGDALCAGGLGVMAARGSYALDAEKHAIRYFRRAIELDPDYTFAHEQLALLLEKQHRTRLEELQAGKLDPAGAEAQEARAVLDSILHEWAEAERLESPHAPFALGVMFLEGRIRPRDFAQGYQLVQQAAERGDADAHYRLGQLHENGDGVPVTLTEAAYHYRLAALEGHRDALRRLSHLYLTGKGVSRDFDRAKFWLLRLAGDGDVRALVSLGDLAMQQGEYREAVKLWKWMERLGDPYVVGCACERLSRCYRDALGVRANPGRAQRYFTRAADLGNGEALMTQARASLAARNATAALAQLERAALQSHEAEFELGRLLYSGDLLAKDETRAWELLRRAAASDHAEALCFLAESTANNVPGAPTLEEAIRFAEQAEHVGLARATVLRERLEQRRGEQERQPEESAAAKAM